MAKKKVEVSYMQEKRFSINDLLLGSCLLVGIVFFAICLFAIDLYRDKAAENKELIPFSKSEMSITVNELHNLYADKIDEVESERSIDETIEYVLTDINKDSIEDLIIKYTHKDSSVQYLFYTYDENSSESTDMIIYVGYINSEKCDLYQMESDNFLTAVSDYAYYIYLDKGNINSYKVKLSNDVTKDSLIKFNSIENLESLR